MADNCFLAWIWLVATDASTALISITIDTLLQKFTPDRLRGKIFGFYSMVTTLIFISATLFVSECLKITSPYFIFNLIAVIRFVTWIYILYFDRKYILSVIAKLYPMRDKNESLN